MGLMDRLRSLFGGRAAPEQTARVAPQPTPPTAPPQAPPAGMPRTAADATAARAGAGRLDAAGAAAMQLIGEDGGNLKGLVDRLRSQGLGEFVDTWIGTGDNMPVSGSRLTSALGSDTIADIAQRLGVPAEVAASQLADALPKLVDKVTPEGRLPDADSLTKHLKAQLGH